VNFREALVFSSSSWIKLSEGLRTLPKGRGNSMLPHLLKFLKAAVSSSSPLISRGYGSPFTKVNGFISRNEKSKSAKRINDHRIIDTGKATITNCLPLESKG
jgi:hypothetical protein